MLAVLLPIVILPMVGDLADGEHEHLKDDRHEDPSEKNLQPMAEHAHLGFNRGNEADDDECDCGHDCGPRKRSLHKCKLIHSSIC